MSGPPDKYLIVATADFKDKEGLATALSNAYLQGFKTLFATVHNPNKAGDTWIILGGYNDQA